MNRPKEWYELPYPIRESLADNCQLKYDPYESSHAESLHELLCYPTYQDDNNKIVQRRYEGLSDAELEKMSKNYIEYLKSQIEEIETMLSPNDTAA
jgi:hypothetical protein